MKIKKKNKIVRMRKDTYCKGSGWRIFSPTVSEMRSGYVEDQCERCGVCKGEGKHNRVEYF